MIKQHLRALILRQRGGHAMTHVLARIDVMDEREAREWLNLLRNMQQDADRSQRQRWWPHG